MFVAHMRTTQALSEFAYSISATKQKKQNNKEINKNKNKTKHHNTKKINKKHTKKTKNTYK